MKSGTWAAGVEPTPAQWAEWFVSQDAVDREALAERVLGSEREAADCFLRNHAGLEDEARYLRSRIAETEALALMVLAVHKSYDGPNGYVGCSGKSCWPSANRTTAWPCTLARAAQDALSPPTSTTTAADAINGTEGAA